MIINKFEYYLLSELITMDDRVTAQRAELLLFDPQMIGCVYRDVLDRMVELLEQSKTQIVFHKQFPLLVEQIAKEKNIVFEEKPNEETVPCRMKANPVQTMRIVLKKNEPHE